MNIEGRFLKRTNVVAVVESLPGQWVDSIKVEGYFRNRADKVH